MSVKIEKTNIKILDTVENIVFNYAEGEMKK